MDPQAPSTQEEEDFKIEILPDDYTQYDLSFKIIVIGDSGVGKSCLTNKATKNVFEDSYNATVGFECILNSFNQISILSKESLLLIE